MTARAETSRLATVRVARGFEAREKAICALVVRDSSYLLYTRSFFDRMEGLNVAMKRGNFYNEHCSLQLQNVLQVGPPLEPILRH